MFRILSFLAAIAFSCIFAFSVYIGFNGSAPTITASQSRLPPRGLAASSFFKVAASRDTMYEQLSPPTKITGYSGGYNCDPYSDAYNRGTQQGGYHKIYGTSVRRGSIRYGRSPSSYSSHSSWSHGK